MTTVTINGTDYLIRLSRRRHVRELKDWCTKCGIDWLTAEVFVPDWPEPGRHLKKSPGFQTLQAGG